TALVHLPATRPDGSVNRLQTLDLRHCTLVPGWSLSTDRTPNHGDSPALVVESAGTALVTERAILGAIRTHRFATASLTDSIVDATDRTFAAFAALDGMAGGGPLTLQGCTVVGKVHASLIALASDSIFWAARVAGDSWASGVVADRKQDGCVRF